MEAQSKDDISGSPNETTTHVKLPNGSSKEMMIHEDNLIHIVQDSIESHKPLQFPMIRSTKAEPNP